MIHMLIFVEGGKQLLESFITANLWDEARVFKGETEFGSGLKAPQLNTDPAIKTHTGHESLFYYNNSEFLLSEA